MTDEVIETDVVVVGGGPVGLAAAHCLGMWNVDTVLVEKGTSPSTHPRATMVNPRSLEIMRFLGVADAVRAGGAAETSARVTWLSSLAGTEIGRIEIIESSQKLMRLAAQSPYFPAICPQNRIESILMTTLAERPTVRPLFGTRALGMRADAGGVEVQTPGRTVRARYAILAEGLHGRMRDEVGIERLATPPLGRLLDIHFAADLRHLTRKRRSVLYWVVNELVQGVIITVDPNAGEWLLEVPALTSDADEALFSESCDHLGLLEAAIGEDVSPTIRSVRTWSMGSTMAASWRDASGRVFVAGDAAHTFPPTGGFGMNTGIQDAHNLAWKLAGVLRGWASPGLLDSYERERRPVAEFNQVASDHNARQMRAFLDVGDGRQAIVLADPGPAGEAARASLAPEIARQRPHFDFQGQALGFRYPSASDPLDGPVVTEIVAYVPSAEVGMRGPHGWLDSGDVPVSTTDLSRDGFAVLASAAAVEVWEAAVGNARAALSVPIRCFGISQAGDQGVEPPGGLTDRTGFVREVYGLDGTAAVLLRPDGHVAARMTGADPDAELWHALAAVVSTNIEEGITA